MKLRSGAAAMRSSNPAIAGLGVATVAGRCLGPGGEALKRPAFAQTQIEESAGQAA
ncbi:hypothetical protein QTH90_19815 [Variovorax sp. J2P1-59]|uniref:hypothetical protein n=1 Tax=Variovorax flavidus TaxID=3053501 RepID=UPI00257918DC|nr:hypothetical protein [Variovorax sp. J2P1-59]MDM0076666.1 hypothetical protein [Variovorax sp. J2P1-59]